jgi:predicted ATP-grasp superfamily ATP-dependent carboligase
VLGSASGRSALIVEHGTNRGTLTAARALDRAGWSVALVSSGESSTGASRSVRSRVRIDYVESGALAFVDTVARVVREVGAEIVFAVDETQLLLLSRHREGLGAVFPYAPHEVLERATDRLEQARLAERAGLAPPRTIDAGSFNADGSGALVVIKARRPALLAGALGASRFETKVGTRDDAGRWISDLRTAGVDAIVQDVKSGGLTSMTVLVDDEGVLVAAMQQTAERIWPSGAGVSTGATTVPVDPDLRERVLVFLEALEWRGLAQLQFIVDAASTPYLIDFNPRFYGSLSLAITAGINFPAIWADLATGRAVAPVAEGRVGVRYHWLGGDLRRALHERDGGLVRDLGASLGRSVNAVNPIWSARDPLPTISCGAAFLRNRL